MVAFPANLVHARTRSIADRTDRAPGSEMSIATTDEQAALQRSIRRWTAGADTKNIIRRAEPHLEPGQPPPGPELAAIWSGIAELGVLGIAVPEEFGGADGSITDVAVGLEEAARGLMPGPLLPTVLAALLLAREA